MTQRRAEMVFDLLDRATRPMRRLMRLQERMERQNRDSARAGERGARQGERAQRTYARAVEASARAQARLQGGIRRSNAAIGRQVEGLRRSGNMMRRGAVNMATGVGVAAAAFTGVSAAAVAAGSAIVGPAAEFERYAIQLETLEGSAAKGQAAMVWIEDFAAKTPLELNQVVQAFTQMKSFGLDPTDGSLRSMLDTMAASGRGFDMLQTQVLALGKAQTIGKLQGESAMMLMESGIPVYEILAEKMGKTVEQIVAMQGKGQLGRDEIALLIEGMGERNEGAAEKISKSWDGIISNLMDQWTRFRRMIADAGVFDHMKARLRGFLDYLNIAFETGELQQLADRIAEAILDGFHAIDAMAKSLFRIWGRLKSITDGAAEALGGYRNLAIAVAAVALRGVLIGTAVGLVQVGLGAAMAVRYLGGLGFAAMAGGALRFGKVLLGLLNPLRAIKVALVAIRIAFISTGIGAILVGIAMAGQFIYQNWGGIKAFFRGIGEGMSAAFEPAAPLIDGIVSAAGRVIDWFGDLTGPIDANQQKWHGWGVSVGQAIGDAINWVVDFGAALKDWVLWVFNIPTALARVLSGLASAAASWLATFAAATASLLAYLAIETAKWFGRVFSVENAKAQWAKLKNFIAEAGASIWDGIQEMSWADVLAVTPLGLAWSGVIALIDRFAPQLWDHLPSIDWSAIVNLDAIKQAWADVKAFIDNAVTSIWDKFPSMPNLKFWQRDEASTPDIAGQRAAGGPVSKGLTYLVGEKGPELFTAPNTGRIVDSVRSMKMMASNMDARPISRPSLVRGGGGSGMSVSLSPTYHIKSSDPAAVRAEIEALSSRTEAQLLEKLRMMAMRDDRRRMAG